MSGRRNRATGLPRFAHNMDVPPRVGLTYRFPTKAGPYRDALQAAGLHVADITPDSAASLHNLCGLVLSGGSDVAPALYGQPDLAARNPDPERDALEIELARAALASGMPLFAICRGMQLLNVVLGGTLHQDIGAGHTHVEHDVVIRPASRLAAICGPTARVNSRHHQAVHRPGAGLAVTACSPRDDIVEGMEMPGPAWVVAVQWHPEDMPAPRPLFDAFAGAVHSWMP